MTGRVNRLLRADEWRLGLIAALAMIAGALTIQFAASQSVTVNVPALRSSLWPAAALLAVLAIWTLSGFRGDQVFFPVCALLSISGYLALLSIQPDLTRLDPGLSQTSVRQSIFIVAGMAVAAVTARFFRFWPLVRRYRYSLLLVCIGLLLVTFVFGTPIGGAKLWISVGPVQIQPSELIKVGLVLFLAAYLDEHRDVIDATWKLGPLRLPPIPYLLPMILMWGTSLVVLVVENDLGSALLLFGIFLVMVYAGTGRPFYVLAGLGSFAAACWLALTLFDRVSIRVQNWLDPWNDPRVTGFQQIQSDYAIAAGGLLGEGFGRGQPWRIPAVQTDYIFSVIGEELGLVGTLGMLALFSVLVVRGVSIAMRTRDSYLRLVAVGLSAALGIQTVVILGGVLRLIPLTGITLPFVSYGGSSMLTNYLIAGLLLAISAEPSTPREPTS